MDIGDRECRVKCCSGSANHHTPYHHRTPCHLPLLPLVPLLTLKVPLAYLKPAADPYVSLLFCSSSLFTDSLLSHLSSRTQLSFVLCYGWLQAVANWRVGKGRSKGSGCGGLSRCGGHSGCSRCGEYGPRLLSPIPLPSRSLQVSPSTNKLTIDRNSIKTYAAFSPDDVILLAAYASIWSSDMAPPNAPCFGHPETPPMTFLVGAL